MSEGLEALKRITLKDFILNNDSSLNDIKIIEKELKQAQEDREVLNVFKNALTIKHTYVFPEEQKSSDDTFSYACRYLLEITQNDIDEKLRKSLREWVLKNAFPEELKDKEKQDHYIKTLEDRLNNAETTYSRYKRVLQLSISKQVNWKLLAWSKKLEEYNDNVLDISMKLIKEEYDLLKEVLL